MIEDNFNGSRQEFINARFDPPSIIFESKSLQRLTLHYCNLSHDDILHRLRAIRIDKRARYLKRFEWSGSYDVNELPSLEIDVPSLEKIKINDCLKRATIDVPNIVMFKYEGFIPESFYFTTTSEKWESDITLWTRDLFEDNSPGLGKVGQLLRALSGSEMSLDFGWFYLSAHTVSSFMDNLFCICRPRIIQQTLVVGPDSRYLTDQWGNQSTKVMCKILGMEKGRFESGRITRGRQWRQDLEKVMFETFDEREEKWHPVVERSWSKFWEGLLPKDDSESVEHYMRFRLTWRE
ncbi:Unknown protein [Striga hermonthica]|uniref:F-box domain-containing protein n=1 Tax=Striga hermonthica TaxID=68872 RepID=A0A9N7NMQ9_STRHE|nr:Unknown protein [Striga hermonthica]